LKTDDQEDDRPHPAARSSDQPLLPFEDDEEELSIPSTAVYEDELPVGEPSIGSEAPTVDYGPGHESTDDEADHKTVHSWPEVLRRATTVDHVGEDDVAYCSSRPTDYIAELEYYLIPAVNDDTTDVEMTFGRGVGKLFSFEDMNVPGACFVDGSSPERRRELSEDEVYVVRV